MKETFTPFNPMEVLHTEEEVVEYLTQCYHDEDPRTFIVALGYVAKAKGFGKIAKQTGLNRENLYRTFSGDGRSKPHFDTVHRVLKALNIDVSLKPL
ncbi:MAG: putative addiction module antidote protein [Cellvibrionales bacterium]|nr:putative addiction module antidote protein [Cellvibrionales bacterium]